ncbi:MAG: heavy metal-binding domain-containing protein [Archaeoglobaceae archaeon]
MIKNAKELGADAVLNVRFATSQTMAGAAELLALWNRG